MNLVPASTIEKMTGILGDHFDTFKVPMVVYRPGKKTVTTINQPDRMYGYGNTQNKTNVTYTADTGKLFYVLETTDDNQRESEISPLKLDEQQGKIKIEVKKDTRDYIKGDKVEKILLFNQGDTILDVNAAKTVNVDSEDAPRNFLGLTYYTFVLKATS